LNYQQREIPLAAGAARDPSKESERKITSDENNYYLIAAWMRAELHNRVQLTRRKFSRKQRVNWPDQFRRLRAQLRNDRINLFSCFPWQNSRIHRYEGGTSRENAGSDS